MAILKKFIGANQVDGSKLLLDNEQAIRAKDAAGNEQSLMKLDENGVLQMLKMPQVASDPVADNDLVRKSYLDGAIEDGVSDLLGQPSGIATLDENGKLSSGQIPALAITDVHVVADLAARAELTVEEGDVAKVTNAGAGLPKTYIYDGSSWIEIESGSDVDTVNGMTGTVVLGTDDIAEGEDNLYFTEQRAKDAAVANSITEDVTDVAPSQDAVFQALALKFDASSFGSSFSSELATKTTDDLAEGEDALYFTEQRAKDAAVADAIVDGVTDVAPSQNAVFDALALKFDASSFGSSFSSELATKTTDDLAEGEDALYFTEQRAKDAAVSNAIEDGVIDVAPSQAAAKAYIDGRKAERMDVSSVWLDSGHIAAQAVTINKVMTCSPIIQCGRVLLEAGADFIMTPNPQAGTSTISFVEGGPIATGGAEALEAGDTLTIYSMYLDVVV